MGKRIWSFINSPIIILIVGSVIVGKGVIIPVIGTQPSIPITVVVILVIFIVMTVSFYLGTFYTFGSFFGWLMKKQKMPLRFRVLLKTSSTIASVNPILRFQGWLYRRKPNQPQSEFSQRILAKLQEKKEQQNEPPFGMAK